MKKFFILIVSFCSILVFGACKNKDKFDIINQNLTNFNIQIDFDNDNKSADCEMSVDYINNTGAVLDELRFNLYPRYFAEGLTEHVVSNTKLNQAYPNGMSYATFEIERVVVDDKDVDVNYIDEDQTVLSVNLNENLIPQNRVVVKINFNFSLPNCQHRFGYGDNTINIANFYPILCVYENGDYVQNGYHSNGDPFYSEVSNYNVELVVDDCLVVAGTGEKSCRKNENKTKYTFTAYSVRDFALVLSEKFNVVSEKYENITIDYYYFSDTDPSRSLKAGVDAIKTFSKLFGKYPYASYSIVETDFVYGGMEYPNLVMISSQIDNHDDYINVIVHETAHQWWYGVVGNNEFELPWLDEAITEFSTILFYDYNEGYNFSHDEMVKINKENYSLFVSVYQDVLGTIDTSMRSVDQYDTEPEYIYCTYVKGVLMYESLYQLIGEKNFLNALKFYYNNNRLKNVGVQDLISAFEKSSKENLDNFFSSWQSGKVVIR